MPDPLEQLSYTVSGMDRIRALENPIRHYAWGSRTVIAEMQGRPSPAPEPEAELWIGAHPSAPSLVVTEEGPVPLPEWIARDPERVLGAEVATRFGGELPFLVKILAVEQPLSLQAHPDAERAREGFRRENSAGIPLESPERCYPDPRPKPELVCALGAFQALKGFRPPAEICRRLEASGLAQAVPGFERLRAHPDRDRWAETFRALTELGPEARRRVVSIAARAAERRPGNDPGLSWVARLARSYPDDVATLAPLFLHVVSLEPGHALFIGQGELHAYLEGVAVEVMANSNNVLRGGLTSKPVDLPELLRVVHFDPGNPALISPKPASASERIYAAPAAEFELSVIDVTPGRAIAIGADRGLEVLLCTAGEAVVHPAQEADSLRLARGSAALVPAAASGFGIEGDATVYRVRVPPPETR